MPLKVILHFFFFSIHLALVGACCGAVLSVYRGQDLYMYSVGMGSNFFMVTAAIFGFEKVASSIKGRSDSMTFAVSGSVAESSFVDE